MSGWSDEAEDTGHAATPDDIPPWHPYDGCHGCRAGNAAARRIERADQEDNDG